MTQDEWERVVLFGGLAAMGGTLSWVGGMPPIKAALACVLGLVVFLFTNPLARWRHRHIPGPPYRPLVGNLPDIMAVGSHAFFEACRRTYGPVFKVWFGARPWVVVADAEMARRANFKLINRPVGFTNPLARGEALRSVQEGLFLSRNATWSSLRRTWQPAFHPDSLAGYAPAMASEAARLCARLRGLAAAEEEVDVWREVGAMTMSVVGSTAYGVDFRLLGPAEGAAAAAVGCGGGDGGRGGSNGGGGGGVGAELVRAAQDMFAASELGGATRYLAACHLMPALAPAVRALAAAFPDARYCRLIEARDTLRATSMHLIRSTRRAAGAAGAQPAPGAATTPRTVRNGIAPGSFLGLLLAAKDAQGHALNDMQMAAQANVFTLAGYETTANTLAYAVYCVASHPAVQARLLAELDALPGPAGREVTADDLPLLPYTAAVVDEALRLYPPGASTAREAAGGLSLAGRAVPDGTTVVVAVYAMQRDPLYWPKADEFHPERWLQGHEELAATHPNAYLPFGSGARMCIGYRFALQEARLTLAQLYREFTFELLPGQVPLRVKTGITMSPAHGVRVRVVLRRLAKEPAPGAVTA